MGLVAVVAGPRLVDRPVAAGLTAVIIAITACQQSPIVPASEPRPTSAPSLGVGHIAIAVTDLESSIAWYKSAFGVELLRPVTEVMTDGTPLGRVAMVLFDRPGQRVRIAQLAWPDGIGLELFEIPSGAPAARRGPPTHGLLHVAVVAADFDAVVARALASGAVPLVSYDANPQRRVAFLTDPDGIVIEVVSSPWDGSTLPGVARAERP